MEKAFRVCILSPWERTEERASGRTVSLSLTLSLWERVGERASANAKR